MAPFTYHDDLAQTLRDLPEYEAESKTVHAIIDFTHPGFGHGSVPGCLMFAVDGFRDDSGGLRAVDGYFWAPANDAGVESEHGSFYLEDLQAFGGRTICAYDGTLTFERCFTLPESAEDVRTIIDAHRSVPGRGNDVARQRC